MRRQLAGHVPGVRPAEEGAVRSAIGALLIVVVMATGCGGSSAMVGSGHGASQLPASAQTSKAVVKATRTSVALRSGTWTAQTNPAMTTTGGLLSAVSFADPLHGWAVGTPGLVVHTSDGGATWARQTGAGLEASGGVTDPHYVEIRDVASVDAEHAWLVEGGRSSTLYATTDGGATWTPQLRARRGLATLAFADGEHGWASYAGIIHTSDAGARWDGQLAPSTESGVTDVSCTDATHIWAARGSEILSSDDGGATWRHVLLRKTMSVDALEFIDADRGWAVGQIWDRLKGGEVPSAVILRTTDGGSTWLMQRFKRIGFASLTFLDAKTGWVLGYGGKSTGTLPILLSTSDGGASWSSERPLDEVSASLPLSRRELANAQLTDVAVTPDGQIWLVGDHGLILHAQR